MAGEVKLGFASTPAQIGNQIIESSTQFKENIPPNLSKLLINKLTSIKSNIKDKKQATMIIFRQAVDYDPKSDLQKIREQRSDVDKNYYREMFYGLRGNRALALSYLINNPGYNDKYEGVLKDDVFLREILTTAVNSDIDFMEMDDATKNQDKIKAYEEYLVKLDEKISSPEGNTLS